MRTAGIIAEYNPFHNGHAWQIAELKKRGFEAVVCVCSPGVVQRGTAALSSPLSKKFAHFLSKCVFTFLSLPRAAEYAIIICVVKKHRRFSMIFSIRNLGFELGSLLLEGWAAFAARVVCAALLLVLGWLARQLLSRKVCPALLRRSWRLAGTPILLRSFAVPVQRLTLAAFIYAAAASLPWAIPGVSKFLLTVFELAATFFVCQGLYAAADLTDLLLANCGEEVRANRTLTTLLNKVYKVLIVVLGIMTMAQETGLPVGSIVASAGLVGLTISLAAQDSAKNLFSGLVILLDRPFSIGDWITVGDVSGEVVDINFRSTKVRALDNSVYILTNSTVSSATINNGTLRNKRLYRFTLGVTYDTTRPQLEQLMTDLTAMLKASPYTYEDSVLVKLSGFGASSIDLLVSAYLRTADMTRFLQMQNDLNLDLMDVMQKNGVDFAFPSTTVYLEKNSEN